VPRWVEAADGRCGAGWVAVVDGRGGAGWVAVAVDAGRGGWRRATREGGVTVVDGAATAGVLDRQPTKGST
jgi:hypothetical protein